MASVGTNKRRRTISNTLTITDLPIGFLVDVSSYLSKPSRAIFAVSLSAPSSSWNKVDRHQQVQQSISDSSKAIIAASDWDTLDFVDIERNLAEKLSDDDLHSILISINATQNLRILKLTNCTNIIGHGLDPLRDVETLKLIDLSLVGKYESPETGSESMLLSQEVVPPILDTIRRTLNYIQFPYSWDNNSRQFRTRYSSESQMYIQFRARYGRDFMNVTPSVLGVIGM